MSEKEHCPKSHSLNYAHTEPKDPQKDKILQKIMLECMGTARWDVKASKSSSYLPISSTELDRIVKSKRPTEALCHTFTAHAGIPIGKASFESEAVPFRIGTKFRFIEGAPPKAVVDDSVCFNVYIDLSEVGKGGDFYWLATDSMRLPSYFNSFLSEHISNKLEEEYQNPLDAWEKWMKEIKQ